MKRFFPAAERNTSVLCDVLKNHLPESGLVLEIGSGTGQHATAFSAAFAHLTWQPSDPDPELRASIEAYRAETGQANLMAPLDLNVTRDPWPIERADVVISINMIHIAPWAAAQGLMTGAGRILRPGGRLFLYGPFFEQGVSPVESNVAFDRSLRDRCPDWGVRRLEDVTQEAEKHGLHFETRVSMPANNLSVLFEKRS